MIIIKILILLLKMIANNPLIFIWIMLILIVKIIKTFYFIKINKINNNNNYYFVKIVLNQVLMFIYKISMNIKNTINL